MMCVYDKLNNELDGKWMDGKWIEWIWRVDLESGAVPDLTDIAYSMGQIRPIKSVRVCQSVSLCVCHSD